MLNRPWGLVLSSVAVLAGTFGCGEDPGSVTGGQPAFKLIAEASSGRSASKVEYERSASETRFEVTYTGGTPRQAVNVSIDGRLAATMTLDSAGATHAAYSSVPDESGELPLPRMFPQPSAGDRVTVGSLQGTFRVNSSDDNSNDNSEDDDSTDNVDDDNDNDADDDNANDNDDTDAGDGEDDSLELEARMSEGLLRVEVNFEVEDEGSKLEIEVRGGEPGAVLDVVIAGVAFGAITLDAEGAAHVEFSDRTDDDDSDELPFPVDFVPPVAGDSVIVGPLSGMFVPDDESDSDDDSDNDSDDDLDDDSDDDSDDDVDDDSDDSDDNSNDNVDDDQEDDDGNANDNNEDDGDEDDGDSGNDNDDHESDDVDGR